MEEVSVASAIRRSSNNGASRQYYNNDVYLTMANKQAERSSRVAMQPASSGIISRSGIAPA